MTQLPEQPKRTFEQIAAYGGREPLLTNAASPLSLQEISTFIWETFNIRNTNILISGCSSGGKSTLLEALSQLGHATVPEPGRRIVAEEMRAGGDALPWVNPSAFVSRALEMAKLDLSAAEDIEGFVFFDRGLVDAAVGCDFAGGPSYRSLLKGKRHYAKRVFLAPPWSEIYVTDTERRHGLDEAKEEYQRLISAFSDLGYEARELPKVPVQQRVKFVLENLGIE